jgi:hypothetical protein
MLPGKPTYDRPGLTYSVLMARGVHCCPIFLLFILPDQRLYILKNMYVFMCIYIYTHIFYYIDNVYELPLLPYNTYGPGVDSASNRNEYQEYFLGVKATGA